MQRDPPWWNLNRWHEWRVAFWYFRVRPTVQTLPPSRREHFSKFHPRVVRVWLARLDHEMCRELESMVDEILIERLTRARACSQ